MEAEVDSFFDTAPADELVSKTTVEKGHGRIETRIYTASQEVSIGSKPTNPIRASRASKTSRRSFGSSIEREYADRCTFDTRLYISSAPLDIERLANAARGHWGVESMHWLLDVEFKDDLSRYRAATAPRTWPSSAASRSASCAPTNPKEASKHAENQPAGIRISSSKSCKSNDR